MFFAAVPSAHRLQGRLRKCFGAPRTSKRTSSGEARLRCTSSSSSSRTSSSGSGSCRDRDYYAEATRWSRRLTRRRVHSRLPRRRDDQSDASPAGGRSRRRQRTWPAAPSSSAIRLIARSSACNRRDAVELRLASVRQHSSPGDRGSRKRVGYNPKRKPTHPRRLLRPCSTVAVAARRCSSTRLAWDRCNEAHDSRARSKRVHRSSCMLEGSVNGLRHRSRAVPQGGSVGLRFRSTRPFWRSWRPSEYGVRGGRSFHTFHRTAPSRRPAATLASYRRRVVNSSRRRWRTQEVLVDRPRPDHWASVRRRQPARRARARHASRRTSTVAGRLLEFQLTRPSSSNKIMVTQRHSTTGRSSGTAGVHGPRAALRLKPSSIASAYGLSSPVGDNAVRATHGSTSLSARACPATSVASCSSPHGSPEQRSLRLLDSLVRALHQTRTLGTRS